MGLLSGFSLEGLAKGFTEGTIGEIMSLVEKGADALYTSDNEKMDFELKLKEVFAKRNSELEETVRAELKAKSEIIKAEMAQGDNFTKRARPMVVYAGLGFIFLNHVLLPLVTTFTGGEAVSIDLPEQFWWSWGSVISIWSMGRTVEKRSTKNESKILKMITGN